MNDHAQPRTCPPLEPTAAVVVVHVQSGQPVGVRARQTGQGPPVDGEGRRAPMTSSAPRFGTDGVRGVANVGLTPASIEINAFQTDGISEAGTNRTLLQLDIGGHDAKFADEYIQDLPEGFKGVLDISSMTPFAALTLRSLSNERHDFLMTSFPIANVNRPALSPIIFPHIEDGGGYTTEFIFLNTNGASNMRLSFWNEEGMLWDMGK